MRFFQRQSLPFLPQEPLQILFLTLEEYHVHLGNNAHKHQKAHFFLQDPISHTNVYYDCEHRHQIKDQINEALNSFPCSFVLLLKVQDSQKKCRPEFLL